MWKDQDHQCSLGQALSAILRTQRPRTHLLLQQSIEADWWEDEPLPDQAQRRPVLIDASASGKD